MKSTSTQPSENGFIPKMVLGTCYVLNKSSYNQIKVHQDITGDPTRNSPEAEFDTACGLNSKQRDFLSSNILFLEQLAEEKDILESTDP